MKQVLFGRKGRMGMYLEDCIVKKSTKKKLQATEIYDVNIYRSLIFFYPLFCFEVCPFSFSFFEILILCSGECWLQNCLFHKGDVVGIQSVFLLSLVWQEHSLWQGGHEM